MLRSNISVVDKSLQQFESLTSLIETAIQNATTVAEDMKECGDRYDGHVSDVEKCVKSFAELSHNVDYLKESIKEVEATINNHDSETEPPNLSDVFKEKFSELQEAGEGRYDIRSHPAVVEFYRRLNAASGDGVEAESEGGEGGEGGEEEDAELVVGAVQVSLVCPLTRKLLENPVTSTKCHHSYSKAAIMEHIRKRPENSKCPVCGSALSAQDLHKDSKLEREVRKARRKKQQPGSTPSSSSARGGVVKL